VGLACETINLRGAHSHSSNNPGNQHSIET